MTDVEMHRQAESESSVLVQTNHGTNVFPGAHSFNIGRQYNIGQLTTHIAGPGLVDILKPVGDAWYLRNRRTSPPDSHCFPGTRLRVINDIKDWVDAGNLDRDNVDPTVYRARRQHLLWLSGIPGSGKSAIAQAVAEFYGQRKRLAASFFFFGGSGVRRRAVGLATTIAAQLAGSIPATATFIEAAIKAHPGLLTSSSLKAQFQLLVLEPFQFALPGWDRAIQEPFLIIMDGLDECEDTEDMAMLMEHLIAFCTDNTSIPLRIIVTSHTTDDTQTRLHSPHVYRLDLANHVADSDLAVVVDATFDRAAKQGGPVQAYGEWPTANDKLGLIHSAGDSFLLLTLLLRSVLLPSQDGQTPKVRLALATDDRLGGLDDLYTHILMRAKNLPNFSLVVSTIALLQEPMSVLSLATLLDVKKSDVTQVLSHLQIIMRVPGDDDTPILFFHNSVREFLVTRSRSGQFHASLDQNKVVLRMRKAPYLNTSNMAIPPSIPSNRPYVLLGYLQFSFNLSLALLFLYLIIRFIVMVQRDIEKRISEYSEDAVQEIVACYTHYTSNFCHTQKAPALAQLCAEWEKCMSRDPSNVGRAMISAELIAGVIKTFVEPKLLLLTLAALGSVHLLVNAVLSAYRSKYRAFAALPRSTS